MRGSLQSEPSGIRIRGQGQVYPPSITMSEPVI